MATKMPFVGRG